MSVGRVQEPGRKADTGKLQWSLIPAQPMREVVRVLTFGSRKYSKDNWMYVSDSQSRYYDACLRHIDAWRDGRIRDKESGRMHLAHAVCCLMFMMFFDFQNSRKHSKTQKL